jgi:hypothetical protein
VRNAQPPAGLAAATSEQLPGPSALRRAAAGDVAMCIVCARSARRIFLISSKILKVEPWKSAKMLKVGLAFRCHKMLKAVRRLETVPRPYAFFSRETRFTRERTTPGKRTQSINKETQKYQTTG